MMLISAIALTVATIAGVLDRRRVLGLLRLTGMPLSTLRSMVALETAVPLLTVLLLSAGAGVFVAWALVTGLNEDRTVQAPGLDYLLTLGAGLVLAVIAVLASFRAVKRFTSAAATRFE
ncbi:MAG: FtsX-like permease family protein [Bosea sp.]|nr:FtsX-like permease family protein [Bosea sp. (in: a-proteobacteria)]